MKRLSQTLFSLMAMVTAGQAQESPGVTLRTSTNPIVLAAGDSFEIQLDVSAVTPPMTFAFVDSDNISGGGVFRLKTSRKITMKVPPGAIAGIYPVHVHIATKDSPDIYFSLPVTVAERTQIKSLQTTAPIAILRTANINNVRPVEVISGPAKAPTNVNQPPQPVPVPQPTVEPAPSPLPPNTLQHESTRPSVSKSGVLTWSGIPDKDGLIRIEGQQAVSGALKGEFLPGVPVKISITPSDIVASQVPSASNGYQRLVLRSTRKGIMVVAIRWEVISAQ